MQCARCKKDIVISEKIGRQSICPHCGAYLHSCLNCRFYAPGRHNDCSEPQAEPVSDKSGANFCEFFEIRKKTGSDSKGSEDKDKARERFEKLFGCSGY
jgi:hypothetical protein